MSKQIRWRVFLMGCFFVFCTLVSLPVVVEAQATGSKIIVVKSSVSGEVPNSVSVRSEPAGHGGVTVYTTYVNIGDTVTFFVDNATDSAGNEFSNWGGCPTNRGTRQVEPDCTVTATDSEILTIEAYYTPVAGGGGGGGDTPSYGKCDVAYCSPFACFNHEGERVVVDTCVDDGPSSGNGGSGGGGSGTITTPGGFKLTVSSNMSDVIIQTDYPGFSCSTSVSGTCIPKTISSGKTVTITAPALTGASGSEFELWSGCDSFTNTACTVKMDKDKSVYVKYTSSSGQTKTPCFENGSFCINPSDCKQIASGENGVAPGYGGCSEIGTGQVCCAKSFDNDSCTTDGKSGTCKVASACNTTSPGVGTGVCNSGSGSNFVCCYETPTTGGDALSENPRDADTSIKQELVPCGLKMFVNVLSNNGGVQYFDECTICHLQILAMNILAFLISIGLVVAALLFANAGILYATSSANPGNITKAHHLFIGTLIGLVLVLVAYALIDVMMKMLLAGDKGEVNGYGPWNTILCPAGGPMKSYTVAGITPVKNTVVAPATSPSSGGGGGGSVPSPTTCAGYGGKCSDTESDVCAEAGKTKYGQLDCPVGQGCCVSQSAGNVCKTSSDPKKTGNCFDKSTCSDGKGEESGDCTDGLVCCLPPAGGGDGPGKDYCSASYLQANGWTGIPDSDLKMAQCICMIESGTNGTSPVYMGASCDRCSKHTDVVVSNGLWQLNMSAGHPLPQYGGISGCDKVIQPPYRPCSETGVSGYCNCVDCNIASGMQAKYNECRDFARDPIRSTQYARSLYNANKFGDWKLSRGKCQDQGY